MTELTSDATGFRLPLHVHEEPRDAGIPSSLFDGSGEMRALMRQLNWASTPLGPVESWPQSLRTMISVLLVNRFPMLVWWGSEYIQLYNDAYRPILGAKHPRSLGQPGSECWSEIWPIIGPFCDTPFYGGGATWVDDLLLEINRYGFLEETHFIIAYSPIPDEQAPRGIGGVLATVNEITEKVIGERRIVALRDLGVRSAGAQTAEDACAAAAQILSKHAQDIPFSLLYLLDPEGERAVLAAASGIGTGESISPLVVELRSEVPVEDEAVGGWPLAKVVATEAPVTIEGLASRFDNVPQGPWSDAPHTAVALPIPSNVAHRLAGVLVMGLSSRLAFGEQYRAFAELLTAQIATSIATARSYEEERKRATALAELDKAKTAFFSNVSHEFRTPLTLMLGPAEDVLADPDTTATNHERAETIHRNALRLLKLVNTMLDFSRIEAGRMRALYEDIDLPAHTAELASNFRSAMDRAGLRLEVDCPALPVSLEPVYVDRDMWEKIVLNLLSNAFKHTFEGEIVVRVFAEDGRVVLTVHDTGVGIAPEELPHVFERFHRVPNARSRTYEGTGIGLTLVQELVKLHGGTIMATSTVDVGTTVTVSLPTGSAHLSSDQIGPRRDENDVKASLGLRSASYIGEALRWLPAVEVPSNYAAPGESEALGAAVASMPDSACIVVADDNADMRQYVTRLFRAQGWNVISVADGGEALKSVRERGPDLVVSDVMMPAIGGFELLQILRADANTRDIPVLLLSARAGEEARAGGMQAGATDYIVKPFSARELIGRVEVHLQRGRVASAERRAKREKMREQERVLAGANAERARLKELFAQAPAAIAVLRGQDHVYESANAQYQRFVGQRDVVGKPIREALPELEGQGIFELMDEVYRTAKPFLADGLRVMLDYDGDGVPEERFFNLVYQPIVEADSSVRGIFVQAVDVTDQIRAQHDAEHARRAAEEANRAKSKFLAAMSHELRTPLNAIAGHVQLIEMGIHGPVTQAQRESLGRVARSEQHLLSLVNDVLNFAKLEAGRVEYEIGDIVLADAVASVAAMIEPQLITRNLRYEARVDPAAVVSADREKVEQIILNLLSNALKFTESGGTITVDTVMLEGPASARVHLRATDTGVGIPGDKQNTIFDPFVQVHRDLTRSHEGTGLGLAISRDLARGMGGDLTVESTPGQGSTFTLTLPRGALTQSL